MSSTIPVTDQPSTWEAAYLRFETPDEEIRKFRGRLLRLGAKAWPRDSQIVELFCGRGGGLRALDSLGFATVEGIDLSPCLAALYDGPGTVIVGDCRRLPYPDFSKDVLIVQGGLHHLPRLPQDLDSTLAEASRVLRPGGRFVTVEPWLTPFLRVVHKVSEQRLARAMSAKIDAFAVMTENEKETYDRWLASPEMILDRFRAYFDIERQNVAWGKLALVGRRRRHA
jgi:ubiquinone/menaquinone biosynthesis C-methylase UbiE